MMESYKIRFELLSNQVWGLSNTYKLSCFLGGSKDEIKIVLRMLNPSNVMATYGLYIMQEENLSLVRRSLRSNDTVTRWRIPISSPTKSKNGFFLRKFVLIFFYDILVYSQTRNKHFRLLKKVLETLFKHQ